SHMDIGWFDDPEHSSGSIGAKLSADASTMRCLAGDPLALLVQNGTTTSFGLIIYFQANWQLAVLFLSLLPLLGVCGWYNFLMLADDVRARQIANNAVGSIRTVASFCAEENVMQLCEKRCEGPRKGLRQGLICGTGYGVSFFLVYSIYATIFFVGGKLIQDGKTTFPHFFC
ncbi:hypothetical protein MKX01_010015, partial [Papaver californicum]